MEPLTLLLVVGIVALVTGVAVAAYLRGGRRREPLQSPGGALKP